jgi:cell division protein FtsN
MKNKDFRELQISSSLLVFIFVGILILGVFIFLLGVSVGKKQVQIAGESGTPPRIVTEQVKAPPTAKSGQVSGAPADEGKKLIADELAPRQKPLQSVKEAPKKEVKPAAETPSPQTGKTGPFFIQVGAFNDKQTAVNTAEEFKKKGYSVLVLDPSSIINKFRVRLGGFPTREEALKALTKLKAESKKKIDYFIAKD